MGVAEPCCLSAKYYYHYYYSPLGDKYERKQQQQQEEVKKKEREKKKRRQTCSTCRPPSLSSSSSSSAGTPATADTHGSRATRRLPPVGCMWQKPCRCERRTSTCGSIIPWVELGDITHSWSALWRRSLPPATTASFFLHHWRNMSYFFPFKHYGSHRLDLKIIGFVN